jgi:hypothetical protein
MIGVRSLTRICVAGLVLCLVYVLALMAGPIQGSCKCEEPSRHQQQQEQLVVVHHLTDDQTKVKLKSDHVLCLLVPFRDRFDELTEFVPAITEFLKKQNISHYIFVINQVKTP